LYYNSEGIKIWKIPYSLGGLTPRGVIENGQRRTNMYISSSDIPEVKLFNLTSGPWKRVYYRKDSGALENIELGARRYGILVSNKSYIIIDGIDVEGPGATILSSLVEPPIYISDYSDNVIVRNLRVSKGQ